MMDYLQTPATAAAGLLGIANLRDQVDVLQHALDQSVEALRIQTLVYLGHVVLYTLLIGPVAWKLVKLLDEQIASLVSFRLHPSPQGVQGTLLTTFTCYTSSVARRMISSGWAVVQEDPLRRIGNIPGRRLPTTPLQNSPTLHRSRSSLRQPPRRL